MTEVAKKAPEVIAGELTVAWITYVLPKRGMPPASSTEKAGEYDAKRVSEFYNAVFKSIFETSRDAYK